MLNQKETNQNLRTQFPVDRKPYTDDYDYDADSDLEEDEDWDSSDVEVVPSKDKSDSSTLVGSQSTDVKGDEVIISVSDMDSLLSDSANTKIEVEAAAARDPTHIGTVVVIDDVAFVTYVCFLLSYRRLPDLVQQIPGAASLLVHERDRVCAMGFCGKTESTRPRGNYRII